MNCKTSLLVLCTVVSLGAETTNRSFFSVKPWFITGSPERISLFRHDFFATNIEGHNGCIEVVAYSAQSHHPERLARYFMPPTCNGCFLKVGEYDASDSAIAHEQDADYLKDLEARHFNIRTINGTFESKLSFNPEYSVRGIGLAYNQIIHEHNNKIKVWIELSAPFETVHTSMNISEKVVNDGGGALKETGLDGAPYVNNMVEAFRQSNWRYGKINCHCTQEQTGLGDIEAKIGYRTSGCRVGTCEISNAQSFLGLVLPTGNYPTGTYMFEPVVGNNHHLGFMTGNSIAVCVWKKECRELTLSLDACSRYLFSNHQMRSLDLNGKPWSRYMEVYKDTVEAYTAYEEQIQPRSQILRTPLTSASMLGTSGINVFTRCVEVSPHFLSTVNWALRYLHQKEEGSLQAEIGYNFSARQAEMINLKCTQMDNIALKAPQGNGLTTTARTIAENFGESVSAIEDPDQGYLNIETCQLDVDTAGHPASLSYVFYGVIGYQWDNERHPALIALGGSYEFSSEHTNNNMDRAALWGKLSFGF